MALALRVTWALVARPGPVSDALGYLSLAERLLDLEYHRRDGPSAFRVPGYPAFLALWLPLSRSPVFLSLVSATLSTALVPVAAVVFDRVGLGRSRALVAAWVVALLPSLWLYAPVLASEHLQAVLLLGAVAVIARPPPTVRRAVAAGVVLGVATLVRPESIVWVAALPFVAGSAGRRCRGAWRAAGVATLAAVAVVTPWVVRNEVVVGRGTGLSTTSGLNLFLAHGESDYGWRDLAGTPLAGLSEHDAHRTGQRIVARRVADDPLLLVHNALRGTKELLGSPDYAAIHSTRRAGPATHGSEPPTVTTVSSSTLRATRALAALGWSLLATLALVGALRLVAERDRAATRLLALVAPVWLCFAVVFWAMPRYRYLADLVLAGFAGAALCGPAPPTGHSGCATERPARASRH